MPKNPYDFREITSPLLGGPEKKELQRDSRRNFNKTQQTEIFRRQKGRCAKCHKPLEFTLAEFDHIKPWELGGKTEVRNGQALCLECHRKKTQKVRLMKVDRKRTKKQPNPFEFKIPQIKLPKGY